MIKTIALFRLYSLRPICSDDNITVPRLMWRNFHLVHNTLGWYKRHWETLIYFKHSKHGIHEKTTIEKLVEEDVLPLSSLAGHWQEGLLRLRESKQTITAPKRRHYESSPGPQQTNSAHRVEKVLRLVPLPGSAPSVPTSNFDRQRSNSLAGNEQIGQDSNTGKRKLQF